MKDACSLHIRYEAGSQIQGQLHVHNIYNPGQATENRESVLPLIRTLLQRYELDEQVLPGDFNLHRRSWVGNEWFGRIKKQNSLTSSWSASV